LILRKEVYANWVGFGYFTGAILIALYMHKLYTNRKSIFWAFIAFSAFLTTLVHFTPLIDKLGMRKLLPPKRDPVKVMVGWEKLGREVSSLYREGDFIFSPRYQIAAELAFYVEGNPRTFVFHMGRMTQYYLWRDGLNKYTGKDAIYVSEWGVPTAVKKSFETHEFLRSVEVFWRGELIKRFRVYRMKGFKGKFNESPRGY